MQRRFVGLLGGSFNPAHGGHRRVSEFAIKALGLDEVWWLVSPGNPLKPSKDMAPVEARYASALHHARASRIRVTAIERAFGTRYTAHTLGKLTRRFPTNQFVWLMGSDNLAQFHRWMDWRGIARSVPIAVIARPGYEGAALTGPAMTYLARYRTSPGHLTRTTRLPALALLRFDPDERSATAIRAADPDWADRYAGICGTPLRDQVTHRPICPGNTINP